MKLMTNEIKKKFNKFGIYGQEGRSYDSEILVKYFNPYGEGVWLITGGEELPDGDFELYGLMHIQYPEWGYVLLSQLEETNKIERDLYLKNGTTVKEECKRLGIMFHEDKNEMKAFTSVKVGIYQLRDSCENDLRKYASLNELESLGERPDIHNYELVYSNDIEITDDNIYNTLESIFAELNDGTPHPSNYYGHSLSVSDVVVFGDNESGKILGAWYCDSISFKRIDDFIDKDNKDNYERFAQGIDVFEETKLCIAAKLGQSNNTVLTDILSNEKVRKERLKALSCYAEPIRLALKRGESINDRINNAKEVGKTENQESLIKGKEPDFTKE